MTDTEYDREPAGDSEYAEDYDAATVRDREIVTLWDGRRGFFYRSHFAGTPIFQPVDQFGAGYGIPELADAEDHELADGKA